MYEKITLYYSKRTGKVKNFATGEHDMSFYGEDQLDYEQIFNYIIVDYDKFIENNFSSFIVNAELGTVVFKNDKYVMKQRNI